MRHVEKKSSSDYHVEQKLWGHEEWIENNPEFCGKLLYFDRGKHSSMHFHAEKQETMYCLKGMFTIKFIDTDSGERYMIDLSETESIFIPRNTPHEIWGISEKNILVEFSTYHEDEDSYRIGRPG